VPPSRAQGGGELPVARPVDLFHPGPQPGDRVLAWLAGEFPPPGRRARPVSVAVPVSGGVAGELGGQGGDLAVQAFQPGQGGCVVVDRAADRGEKVGDLGELPAERGEVSGLAVV
jgi:hypothetical protein